MLAAKVYSNVCFTHNLARQRYYVGRSIMNVCQFNPVAQHWRRLFCEATSIMGIALDEIETFCSDSCYFRGQMCLAGVAFDGLLGPVNGTLEPSALAHRQPGLPAPEALKSRASFRSAGGPSGPKFSDAVRFEAALLPRAPFTVLANMRSSSDACQAIASWGSGPRSCAAAELRLEKGRLVYAESGPTCGLTGAFHKAAAADQTCKML